MKFAVKGAIAGQRYLPTARNFLPAGSAYSSCARMRQSIARVAGSIISTGSGRGRGRTGGSRSLWGIKGKRVSQKNIDLLFRIMDVKQVVF